MFSAAKSNAAKRKEATQRGCKSEVPEVPEVTRPLPFNAQENQAGRDHTIPQCATLTSETKNAQAEGEINDRAAEQEEEFDLREAVIYSEILKPKFEEQSL